MKPCAHCGTMFTPRKDRREQKYCGRPCSIKASGFNGNRNKFKGEVRR